MSSCFYWNSASFYITQWSQHMVAVWWFVLCIANSWYLCTACLIGWQEMEKEEGSAGIACRNVTLFLTTRAEHMSNMFLLSVHWPTCVKLRTCTIARGCSREVASTLLLSLCAMSLLFPLLTFQLTDISALFSEAILKNYHGISLCSVNTEESAKWSETAWCKVVAHTSRLLCTFVMHSIIVQKKKCMRQAFYLGILFMLSFLWH